ncbi:hypothetical protein [Paenibacillus sp. LHD-38]|uniref:hypothetical protein n=1 Tax=Paenibacillus sp. LHD-38 TaxID=3072143 RepID=UPI00281018FA|nr:hypothetical protein [Paenibacillus sp. LHD-38]MDQ8733860.1 hypothetical protein [Paenibacillus sp. LHD-38]
MDLGNVFFEDDEQGIQEEELEVDIYAKEYGDLYINKIKELKQVITTHNTGENAFNVFSLEAGLGKSLQTLKIIDANLDDWDNPLSFLIIRRFKADIEHSEKYLEKHNNSLRTNVLGITSDNWGEWQFKLDKLKDISVLIISHQRYINLCLDDAVRQAFMENRDVLVIDEKVNFPIYTFSKKTYDEVRSLLHTSIQPEYDKVCQKLLKELQKQEVEKNKNKVVRCEPKIHPATIENFQKVMEVNIENEKDKKTRNTLKHFMAGLDQWYSTKCVYNGGNISTYNRKHKLWGLKNNIILDASAGIDGIYNLGDFKLIGQERIVDHSNSMFTIINFNSSKSHLRHNQSKFYPEICEKIKANHKSDDKTLIICHKDNHKAILELLYKAEISKIGVGDEYNGENFAINWFGNLIGKNEYSKFTQCWIIGTPNIPYEQYLVQYMMYKQSDLGKKSIDIERGRFKNNDFKAVQIGYIASEIYQSIKRIQRNEMPQGEFYIVNGDEQIVSMVLSQIKGTDNVKTIEMDFQQENKGEKKRDNIDIFVDYVFRLSKGEYQKKDVFQAIGITTNFNRILTDARVKALLPTDTGLGIINVHNKYIEKLTDPINLPDD